MLIFTYSTSTVGVTSFSSVHIVGSLTSKLPSIMIMMGYDHGNIPRRRENSLPTSVDSALVAESIWSWE